MKKKNDRDHKWRARDERGDQNTREADPNGTLDGREGVRGSPRHSEAVEVAILRKIAENKRKR